MTDPHVHQKLHDHHAEKWGRYIGWWYNTDIWGLIDSQVYSYAYHTQMLNIIKRFQISQYFTILIYRPKQPKQTV